jgi:hypothetical protein
MWPSFLSHQVPEEKVGFVTNLRRKKKRGKSWLCDEFVTKKKKEERVGFVTNWHELLPRRQFKEVLWYQFT